MAALNGTYIWGVQVRLALELMFEGVQGVGDICSVTGDGKREALRMADAVTVVRMPAGPGGAPEEHLVVEWEGGAASDMLADAVVAVILQVAHNHERSMGLHSFL